jgi:hypothetical protein
MEQLAYFDIPQPARLGLIPGVTGIVITINGTFLAKFVRQEQVTMHNLYYFEVIYSKITRYKQGDETYVMDYELKHFFPVEGPIRVASYKGNTFILTNKQTYPL